MTNWALRDFGVEVPRGGAVVLPGRPVPQGYEPDAFAVRAVFLDGTEPTDLVDAVLRHDALPRELPERAEEALTALREDWHLLTLAEELERERALVAMYAEALDAMTKSRGPVPRGRRTRPRGAGRLPRDAGRRAGPGPAAPATDARAVAAADAHAGALEAGRVAPRPALRGGAHRGGPGARAGDGGAGQGVTPRHGCTPCPMPGAVAPARQSPAW
ncbi:hypothetical protein STENM223S_04970 [Streptomyces tendae]